MGGKGEYARDVELVETAEGVSEEEMEARLFNIKFYMGVFHATEICNFE